MFYNRCDINLTPTDMAFQMDDLGISSYVSKTSSTQSFSDVKNNFAMELCKEMTAAFNVENRMHEISHNLFTYLLTSGQSFADFEVEIILDRLGNIKLRLYFKIINNNCSI